MKIRSYSWGKSNISWSTVIEELLHAAEEMDHDVAFISTNGYDGTRYWNDEKGLENDLMQRQLVRDGGVFDIDLTYTVPQNFPQRFRPESKCKMAIYAYESSIMPPDWKKYYHIVDYMLPPSQYVADMMERNGCPKEKIVVVPHGVDLDVFNPDVKPLNIGTDKTVKFLCVAEPHVRKQLDKLLKLYCESFTSDDDVCFVLKTKLFNPGDKMKGFEINLKPILLALKKKYGKDMPEIKVIGKRLKNIAPLYTACDAFVLMTASEGWGVPYLEALACGIPVIAPKQGGQLQFLNDDNSILTKCGIRRAKLNEQYWKPSANAMVGNPSEQDFADAMYKMYDEISLLKSRITHKPRGPGITTIISGEVKEVRDRHAAMIAAGLATAQSLTWKNAMQQIIDLAKGKEDNA